MCTDLFNDLIVPLLPEFDGAQVSYKTNELDKACQVGDLYAIDLFKNSGSIIRCRVLNPYSHQVDWNLIKEVRILFNHAGEEIRLVLENGKVIEGYHEYPSGKVVDWSYSK